MILTTEQIPPNTTEFTYDDILWKKMTDRPYFKPVGVHIGELAYNQLFHRYIWLKSYPIPPKFIIHHIDSNPLNCNLLNLSCLSKRAHAQLHLNGIAKSPSHKASLAVAMKGNHNRPIPSPETIRKAVHARYINKMKRYFNQGDKLNDL